MNGILTPDVCEDLLRLLLRAESEIYAIEIPVAVGDYYPDIIKTSQRCHSSSNFKKIFKEILVRMSSSFIISKLYLSYLGQPSGFIKISDEEITENIRSLTYGGIPWDELRFGGISLTGSALSELTRMNYISEFKKEGGWYYLTPQDTVFWAHKNSFLINSLLRVYKASENDIKRIIDYIDNIKINNGFFNSIKETVSLTLWMMSEFRSKKLIEDSQISSIITLPVVNYFSFDGKKERVLYILGVFKVNQNLEPDEFSKYIRLVEGYIDGKGIIERNDTWMSVIKDKLWPEKEKEESAKYLLMTILSPKEYLWIMPQLIEAPTYMLIIDAFLPHDGKLISNVKGKIGNIRESINRYGKSEMKYFTLIK